MNYSKVQLSAESLKYFYNLTIQTTKRFIPSELNIYLFTGNSATVYFINQCTNLFIISLNSTNSRMGRLIYYVMYGSCDFNMCDWLILPELKSYW